MSQPQTRIGKFYIGTVAFILSQALFFFNVVSEADAILSPLFFTAVFGVLFFLVKVGLNWARWILIVFLIFFSGIFIFAAVAEVDYVWVLCAAGYIVATVMLFQMKQVQGKDGEVQENQDSAGLNTGSFTSNGIEYDYPQLVTRIKALFIDGMIILSTMVIVMVLMDDSEYRPTIMITLGALGVLLYEPVLTMTSGTIGQRIMNIRVRDFQDPSKKIGIMQAYGRAVVKSLLGWMSFLTINFNPQHRAIHDFVGGSVMVNAK